MAEKNKASKFEGMTDDQILTKAKELTDRYKNTPKQDRPQDFYDFGNKAVEINRARRATREKARSAKETAFNTGLATTWVVPKNLEQTRNRLAALIMQESGPRADATPEYTLLGERLVASALKNYMTEYGLTSSELISGKGHYGGANYLSSITDAQQNPEQAVYDWANDKFNLTKFVQDDTTFNHMTNAVRLASALVNGTLRPLTSATNFRHLDPDDKFEGMTEVGYDFGTTPIPTNRVLKLYIDPKLRKATRQDAKGGDTRADTKGGDASGSETAVSETPVSEPAPQSQGGPRIVINPSTFHNEKDAACVMWNEGFRILMEYNGFDPVSEPTDEQRRFFSDTAYADDELQLRRTILARICTFDTSVKDPTDEQLQEAVEFLETVMEIGAPQNEWEQKAVQRLRDVIAASVGRRPEKAEEEEPPEDEGTVQGAIGGGMTDEERNRPENMVDAEGARAAEVATGAQSSYQQGDENLPGQDRQTQAGQAQAPAEQTGQAQAPAEQTVQPQTANAEQSPTDQQAAPAQPEKPAQEPVADAGTERFLYSWSSSGQMELGEGSTAAAGAAGADRPNGRPARRTIDQDIVPAGAKGSLRNSSNSAHPITQDIVPKGAKGSISNSSSSAHPITQDIVPKGAKGSISNSSSSAHPITQDIVPKDSPGSLSYKKKRETT